MKESWISKSLVFIVILLFIGVAISPSINFNVVKASTDNDLVEVYTQACGIKGFGDTTVKLTRQQYHNLEQYLVDFRARLNKTTTREEAVPLFKEAVVELDKYGLLPKRMSVEKAQKLVIGQNQNKNMEKLKERLMRNRLLSLDNNSNLLCLIAGETASFVIPPLAMLSNRMVITYVYALAFLLKTFPGLMKFWENFPILNLLVIGPMIGSVILFLILWNLHLYIPIAFGSGIAFGAYGVDEWGQAHYNPSDGWIHTFGAMGKKIWENGLYGQLYSFFALLGLFYIGVIGFTGITIYNSRVFYLGFAPIVKISHEPLDDSSFVGQSSQQSQSNPSSQQSNQLIQNLIVRQQTTR
jgi:hypothetical protein